MLYIRDMGLSIVKISRKILNILTFAPREIKPFILCH